MINGMKITDVVVYPLKKEPGDEGKLFAFAKVILNDQFIVHGIRVYEGVNGPFISYPQDRNRSGDKNFAICHPTTADLRNYINEQVLAEYQLTKKEQL